MDTIELGEHWELIGGLPLGHVRDYLRADHRAGVDLNRTDNMPSWRAAIVYKPLPNGSVYFAYGTSFNPSAETLSLARQHRRTSRRRRTRRSRSAPSGWSTTAA